jgi:hypothetical protein
MAMDERERRLGLNEAVFREVNERVEEIHQTLGSDTGTLDIICECGVVACTERISVPIAEYERARSDPTHFLLQVGHEDPTVERMIENHGTYILVEKEGTDVEEIAEATDPRRDERE